MSFRTKLLASHVALVVAVGLLAMFILNRSLTLDLIRQLDQRLEEQARGAIEWAEEGGRRHPEKVATRIAHIVDAEVTLFDSEGAVIGASSQEARADIGEELTAVRAGGIGRATRLRGGQEIHYVAITGEGGIVIRLAVPLSEISETVGSMRRRLLFASSLAIAVAIALGFLAARIASRPLGAMTETATRLAQGDFDVPIETDARDEFGILWRALKSLARQLKARIGQIESERDNLSAILAGMAEGVLVVDRSGNVLVANEALEKILGAAGSVGPPTEGTGAPSPSESIVGKRFEDVVANDDVRRLIGNCFRGEVEESELEITERHGMTIAVYVRPLPDTAEGALVAVLRDLTALRRLMTVRRDFVANVSHELRTPVTAIQGYAETLLRGKTDEKTSKQFLEIVHRQAVRIGTLVEQLLALSELEVREQGDVAKERVPVEAVARHVAEAVRGRADARGTKIDIAIQPGAVALADPEGTERAILNLVENAIKYGKDGGVVAIGASRKNGKIEISVSDDGPGIDPTHVPRLFERFYRVDPGRSRAHGGAGLGLSIVKHLVDGMNGSVAVTSELGRGTRFLISLPAFTE